MPITQADAAGVMKRLGLPTREGEGVLHVTPPSWRFDLQIEEDLIEEVIRVMGYDKLPATPPIAPIVARVPSESRRSAHALRRLLADLDYTETINFSFVEERWERELAGNGDPIRVLNPIASPLAVMRSSLVGSLVNVLRYNLARKAARVRVFEIGRVFRRDAGTPDADLSVAGIDQPARVGGLAYGPADTLQWGTKERPVDFYDVKGDIESLFAPQALRFVSASHPALHPGRAARIEVDGRDVGVVGELHPRWRQAYELPAAPIVFELDLEALQARALPRFVPLPRHQPVWRDISLVANDTVTHESLMAAIRSAPTPLVRSALLYDVYKPSAPGGDIGSGERSMTLRLELLDDDNTLTDDRIEAARLQVVDLLRERLGVRLRG